MELGSTYNMIMKPSQMLIQSTAYILFAKYKISPFSKQFVCQVTLYVPKTCISATASSINLWCCRIASIGSFV